MEVINEIMSKFEYFIEKALENAKSNPDKILIDTYYRFRTKFQELTGTGSNITAVSEFLYFEFVKRFLIDSLPIAQFSIYKGKKVRYFFAELKNGKLVLSSDIGIKKYFRVVASSKDIKPDIFIGIEKDGKVIPVAMFEVKLWRPSGKLRTEIVERFRKIKNTLLENNYELPYFVLLSLHSKDKIKINQQINDFKNISEKCEVMRKVTSSKEWDSSEGIYKGVIEGSITEILEKIVVEIKLKLKMQH